MKLLRLSQKLKQKDWAGFARGYNGPAYAKYGYHKKMAKAYARFSRELEFDKTIISPKQKHAYFSLKLGSLGQAVIELQTQLANQGFALDVDGDFGLATERAVKRFQAINALEADGIVGPDTQEILNRALPQPANFLAS